MCGSFQYKLLCCTLVDSPAGGSLGLVVIALLCLCTWGDLSYNSAHVCGLGKRQDLCVPQLLVVG